MPEIQTQFQLEIHISQMIPMFIENLGSPKAIVRKSSHKCIGTYVKLTKKLEYVIKQIIKKGLENQNSRTRQHSMLVIPALISLKSQIMDTQTEEMKELVLAVIRRIQMDSSEIVAKTGKKLVLELQKCYPQSFKANYIDCLRDQKTQKICEAIILNDETGLKEVLHNQENNKFLNSSVQKEEYIPVQQLFNQQQNSDSKQSISKKIELSNIGREVISPAPVFDFSKESFQRIIEIKSTNEVQNQKFDGNNFQNLHFGFVPERIISSMNEQKDLLERTEALQNIENLLNEQLQTLEKKEQFIIYQNQFVEFLIPLIKDQTFKISLIAINMMNKLLVLDLLQNNIHFNSIVITLIEKFSDIKIIIRQAILKCCGLLIKKNNPYKFAEIAINYIKHTNWHVREGILHLIANCLIIQEQNNELMGSQNMKAFKEQDHNIKDQDLTLNSLLIGQLCLLLKNESKEKIQQMAIDNLSLCLEVSTQHSKTQSLIFKEFQIDDPKIDGQFMKKIKERQNNECLPSMQIDGSIEFKPLDVQQMLQTAQMNKNHDVFIHRNRQNVEIKSKDSIIISLPTHLIQDDIDLNSNNFNNQSFKIESSLKPDNSYLYSKLASTEKDFQIVAKKEDISQNIIKFQEEKSSNLNNRIPQIIKTLIDPSPIQQDQQSNNKFEYQKERDRKNLSISKGNQLEQSSFLKSEKSFEKPKIQGIQTKEMNHLDNENRFEKLMSGYTPIQHSMKPRIIQSNETRQRTIENNNEKKNVENPNIFQKTASNQIKNTDFISLQNQSPIIISNQIDSRSQQINYQGKIIDQQSIYINGASSVESQNQTGGMQSDFQSTQIRNMSQSSGAPGGFKVSKALINERLQLLKSTFKYKNQSDNETRSYIGEMAEGVGRSNFESAERRLQFEEFIVGTIKQKAISEYNPREDIKLPAVHQNNNNFMMQQTNGSGIMSKLGESGNPKEKNAQSTHNSFGLSNVSTNLNHNHQIEKNNNFKSFSANKQLQSTNNTSGSNNFSNNSQNFIGKDQRYNQQRNESYNKNAYLNDQNNQSVLNKSNFQENEQIESYGGLRNSKNKYQQNQFGSKGPVKAVSLVENHQEYLNTIQQEKSKAQPSKINSKYQQIEDNISFNQSNSSKIQEQKKQNDITLQMSSQQNKSQSTTKKPPINTLKQQQAPLPQNKQNIMEQNDSKHEMKQTYITPTKNWIFNSSESQISNNLVTQNSNQTAIQFSNAFDNTPQGESQNQTSTHYNSPEEPLINPDSQFKQSISNLNSQDWQKVFESLNIIKRVAQFHKELLSMTEGNFLPKECIKNVVKQTENLRSQVAKNACMTLQVIYTELPTKDLDGNIDIVISALLKKSTDTNHFVSEQAEKALKMVCHACSETKIFNSLNNQEVKSNIMKQKIALGYCFLIEKLGFKIKDFKENGKLVKCISNMLGEGSLEVRNQGKSAIIQIKNNFQNGREFDILLMKSGLTDKQTEQIRKVVDQSEQASLANTTNYTRYGGSIRGSSLDSRVNPSSQNHSEYKQDPPSNYNLQIQKSAQSKAPYDNAYEQQSKKK